MYTKVSYPALKQIPTTVSVNSWLIVLSKMATALTVQKCQNHKKRKHVEIWAAKLTRKNRWNSKELQNETNIVRMGSLNRLHFHAFAAAFPGPQVSTPSRSRTFNIICCIHFSELHEGHIEFRRIWPRPLADAIFLSILMKEFPWDTCP